MSNLLEKYHVYETLDYLDQKYGPSWVKQPDSNPDFAAFKNFRNAMNMNVKHQKEQEHFDKELKKVFFKIHPLLLKGYNKQVIAKKANVSITDINKILRQDRKLNHLYQERFTKRHRRIVIIDTRNDSKQIVRSMNKASIIVGVSPYRVRQAIDGPMVKGRYWIKHY